MKRFSRILVAVLIMAGPPKGGHYFGLRDSYLRAQQDEAGSPRQQSQVTLLQINDVYSTIPINGAGGLARVATLKQRMSSGGHPVLMLLAGDFLSPSVASSVFKGEQMIATLNAAGLDYATLGNHEFDFGINVLKQRMAESSFTWVVSNVVDAKTGGAIGKAVPYAVKTIGGLKIGFIGLCITSSSIAPAWRNDFRFLDPTTSAAKYLPMLKREGRQRRRRAHASRVQAGPGDRAEVSADRRHRRRPRALPHHNRRRPRAHQQGRIRREIRGAARHPQKTRARRHGRAILRADPCHERDSRRTEDSSHR